MMPDREKVIKALEYCVLSNDCRPCEYWMEFDDTGCQIMKDALALLKEQEAKPPAIMQDAEGIWSTCSICGHKLRPILAMKMDTHFPKFCSECGQPVLWEGR